MSTTFIDSVTAAMTAGRREVGGVVRRWIGSAGGADDPGTGGLLLVASIGRGDRGMAKGEADGVETLRR